MDYQQEVNTRLAKIKEKSSYLETPYGSFPTKGGDGGDDCLWHGLLASTGVKLASRAMYYNQIANGMFYRNPLRASNNNAGYSHFFSRDMACGVLCAFATEGDTFKRAAEQWINFIHNNRPCKVKKPRWMGGGCLVRHPFYMYCDKDDSRSNITPAMWALKGRVWQQNGWPLSNQMRQYAGMDGDVSVIEAEQAPLGYQLHLKAVQAYLKYLVQQSREYRQKVSKICYERLPQNLFYKVLSQEKAYTEDFKAFLEIMPNPDTFVPKDYWIWEKGDLEDGIQQKKFCGWDLIFMGNMLNNLAMTI